MSAIGTKTPVNPNYLDGLRALELAYGANEFAQTRCSIQLITS